MRECVGRPSRRGTQLANQLRTSSTTTLATLLFRLGLIAMASATYHDICYAVFREKSLPHPAAPELLQCVSTAGAHPEGLLKLDEVTLPAEQTAWLRSKLLEIGFVDGSEAAALRAEPALIDRLVKEQNAARRLVHKEAEAQREQLLDALLRGEAPPPTQDRPTSSPARRAPSASSQGRPESGFGGARAALDAFCAGDAARELARGPLLLGAAALLRAQSEQPTERQAWACDRAVLLNGGDAFVVDAVRLLQTLAMQPSTQAADVEVADGQIRWAVQPNAWSLGELRALAALAERRGKKIAMGTRASGQVVADSGGFKPYEFGSWQQWLHAWLATSLARLAG